MLQGCLGGAPIGRVFNNDQSLHGRRKLRSAPRADSLNQADSP
jgi:hypothetical protein